MSWTDSDKPKGNLVDAAHLRKFGAVMAAAFGILSAVAWRHGSGALPWTVLVAVAFFFVGLLTPRFLAPLEKVWMALAEKMSHSDDLADSHVDVFCPHYTDWSFTQIDLARQLRTQF